MGYRSTIVIGIDKQVLARDLLTKEIPDCLKRESKYIDEDAGIVYWRLEDWKWYPDYKDIQAIEHWFDDILDGEEFGAMRLGEEQTDIETWGDPYKFGIELNQHIDSPIPY